MEKIQKTNAARLLDRAHIAYRLIPYEVDENNLAATHVAESLGEEIGRVFKTIVLRGERTGYFFRMRGAGRRRDRSQESGQSHSR